MAKPKSLEDLLDELARLIALQTKVALGSQAQAVVELERLGFSTARISQLLGTTPNTVNVTVQKHRKRKTGDASKAQQGDSDEK